MQIDTNHSTINTHLMKGATSRKPSSEDNNENEAMEMSNLKLATDESISNYSSIHRATSCITVVEQMTKRYEFPHF